LKPNKKPSIVTKPKLNVFAMLLLSVSNDSFSEGLTDNFLISKCESLKEDAEIHSTVMLPGDAIAYLNQGIWTMNGYILQCKSQLKRVNKKQQVWLQLIEKEMYGLRDFYKALLLFQEK
jgi:hypothetical protein